MPRGIGNVRPEKTLSNSYALCLNAFFFKHYFYFSNPFCGKSNLKMGFGFRIKSEKLLERFAETIKKINYRTASGAVCGN